MSDAGSENGEEVQENPEGEAVEEVEKKPTINYDEIDNVTGFKKVDKQIWDALKEWKNTGKNYSI